MIGSNVPPIAISAVITSDVRDVGSCQTFE